MNATDIEIACSYHFDREVNIVVPNFTRVFGLGHEADLVVLRPSGWADEVEIKCRATDIVADTKKRKWRLCDKGRCWPSELFRRMWFAVPHDLADHPAIPEFCGVIAVYHRIDYCDREFWTTRVVRESEMNPGARKFSGAERLKLLELAYRRIWTLKGKREWRPADPMTRSHEFEEDKP